MLFLFFNLYFFRDYPFYYVFFYCAFQGSRARALYKAGLRTSQAIAEASTSEIFKALFESSSWAALGETSRCFIFSFVF